MQDSLHGLAIRREDHPRGVTHVTAIDKKCHSMQTAAILHSLQLANIYTVGMKSEPCIHAVLLEAADHPIQPQRTMSSAKRRRQL
jgi:hypothetical protein